MNDPISGISKSEIRFSLALYKAIASAQTDAFTVSTVNIFLVLSQLYYGANGLNKQQLSNVLHYPPGYDEIAEHGLWDIAGRINFPRNVGTSMHSAIFHTYKSIFEPSFMNKIFTIFGSQPREVTSLKDRTNGEAIRSWTKRIGIKNPYKNKFFEEPETMALASAAIYRPTDTIHHQGPCNCFSSIFYYTDNSIIHDYEYVTMTDEFIYGEISYPRDSYDGHVRRSTAQYLRLVWPESHRNKLETFIILPGELTGIKDLEKSTNAATIHKIISNKVKRTVIAILPKSIEIDSSNDHVEPLKNMGLTEMIKGTTEFKRIVENSSIKVTSVIDQMQIRYNVDSGCGPCRLAPSTLDLDTEKTFIFNANRPFMMLTILNDENPIILFMGRYGGINRPTARADLSAFMYSARKFE